MKDTKTKTKTTNPPISRPIKAEKEPERKKTSAADIVDALGVVNNTNESIALLLTNVIEELRESNKLNAKIARELEKRNETPPVQQAPIIRPTSNVVNNLPPAPEVPVVGKHFQPTPAAPGDPRPTNPTSVRPQAPAPIVPGAVSPAEAGRILKEKMAKAKQGAQIPSAPRGGASAGGAIAKQARPIDGIAQVGDFKSSLQMDWLGENHPSG